MVSKQFCQRLHHDVSANVLVFLSHLTDHPIVLSEMRTAAGKLFEKSIVATMTTEVETLNKLDGVESFFALPPTAPEVNRRLLQDADDEQHAKERDLRIHDGRTVRAISDSDEEHEGHEEAHSSIREIRASLRTIRILGQVLRNKALSMEGQDKIALMEEVVLLERRLLGYLYGFLDHIDEMIVSIRKRLMRLLVEAKQKENREAAEQDGKERASSAADKLSRSELKGLWLEAEIMANRFWFDMYWLGSVGLTKRVASAIGSRELDATLAKIKAKDGSLPVQLVELASRLHRRTPSIPVEELVDLHKRLSKEGNKLARVVLEAIVWERLLLFDTDVSQKQAICKQMGIDVPVQTLDQSRKKFLPSKGK